MRLLAVRLHRRAGEQRGLRRAGRTTLREPRVRKQEESQFHLCDHPEPHTDVDIGTCRHHRLDADVDCGPRGADRLLDPLLLGRGTPALAVAAVKDGRADTFMFDDAFLLGVATQDRDLKLTGDKFLNVPWGIGIRKGDTAMSRWVNAALRYMKKKDEFVKILRANAPARLVPGFLDNVPRPKNTFAYPVGKDVTTICP